MTIRQLAQYLYERSTYLSIRIPWQDLPEKIHDGYILEAVTLLDKIGYKDMYEAIKLARMFVPTTHPHVIDKIDKIIAKTEEK
jgi:hypothetical protein